MQRISEHSAHSAPIWAELRNTQSRSGCRENPSTHTCGPEKEKRKQHAEGEESTHTFHSALGDRTSTFPATSTAPPIHTMRERRLAISGGKRWRRVNHTTGEETVGNLLCKEAKKSERYMARKAAKTRRSRKNKQEERKGRQGKDEKRTR
jgi:hypothetical protein